MASNIDQIFLSHGTDKSSKHHNYSRQYEAVFARYRSKPVRVLEIGVQNGHSIRSLREIFPAAVAVVGLDIDPSCKASENASSGIFVEIGDASDAVFLAAVHAKHGPFDVIIDDGSHFCSHVIASFEALFPLMENGGVYVVEDTGIFTVPPFNDVPSTNHIQYFANLLPFLNMAGASLVADPFKIPFTAPTAVHQGVDRLEFGCGFVAVHKLVRHHWAVATKK